MREVERVAGAGVVDVEARLVRHQAVVRHVVDAPERQRGPALVAFGGVVVDHVENDLEARMMQAVDHRLELVDRVLREVARVGREEADRVVAPVVRQALVEQVVVVDERVDRQQLDGRHAETGQVLDHRVVREAGERAAQRLRHRGVPLRETTHVRLVEDHLLPWHARPGGLAPREVRVDHDALRHERRAVPIVESQVRVVLTALLHRIAEQFGRPGQRTHVSLRVRIEQQLRRVEAMPLFRFERAVHAVPVDGADFQPLHVDVPDLVGVFGQGDAADLVRAVGIEQAQFDAGRVRREEREVDAMGVGRRPQRIGKPFGDPVGEVAGFGGVRMRGPAWMHGMS